MYILDNVLECHKYFSRTSTCTCTGVRFKKNVSSIQVHVPGIQVSSLKTKKREKNVHLPITDI